MTAVLPKLIETIYSHLATENGTYQLPFIMWYVSMVSVSYNSHFHHFSSFERTPFDWRTPWGYVVAFGVLWIAAFFLLVIFTCSLSLFTGSCTILIAFAEDIKVEIWAIDKANRNTRALLKFRACLFEYIQLYLNAKQLSSMQLIPLNFVTLRIFILGFSKSLQISTSL